MYLSCQKSIFSFLLFIFLSFVISPLLLAQEKDNVSKITIKGLVTIPEDKIKTKLETQVNRPFSSLSLKKDIQRMHELGFFANIEIQVNQTLEGVEIIFIVIENQLLGEVKILGNKDIETREILKKLRIAKEKYLAAYILSLDIIQLKEFYQKKGYLFVDIKAEKKPSGGWIDLYFFIDEGPQVTLETIQFFGNKTFSKSELCNLMQTKENGFLSSSYYDEETFQEDLILIRNFYRSEAFLDARVHLRDIFYSDDRTKMVLNISVEEGPRYTIESITFSDNKLFSKEELQNRLLLKKGDPFKQAEVGNDKTRLERLYGENGFLNIRVNPVIWLVDLKKTEVAIDYKVKEGSKVYLRKVDIQGNTLTRDDVVRREMVIHPGEQFNLGKLENSQMRLRRLRYFESLKVDLLDTEFPHWKDLLIQVEEGRTGNLRFAAGITSDLGAVGEISLSKRNFDITRVPKSFADFFSGDSFTGAGQNLDIFFQVGQDMLRFKISFLEPYLFGYDWSLGTDLYNTARGRESWSEDRLGMQLSIGRKVGQDSIVKLSYRLESVNVDDVDNNAPRDVVAVEGRSLVSAMSLEFSHDTRDDFILPTRGYSFAISAELGGVLFGGDHYFSKLETRFAWFTTLYTLESGYKHVLSLGGQVSMADDFNPSDDVPIFERYFAGGASSIRGFQYRTVSPRENFPGLEDDPIGGNFMALGTIEYSFPLYQDVLRMVVFMDIGNVTPQVSSEILDSMRVAAGFGVRIKVPLLGPRPFALDFGFPLRKEEGDDTQVFSFSFGKQF